MVETNHKGFRPGLLFFILWIGLAAIGFMACGGDTSNGTAQNDTVQDSMPTQDTYSNSWRQLPIRSEQEFLENKIGGEAQHNFVRTICVDPNDSDIVYAATLASGHGCIFRSMDGGITWKNITGNLPRNGMSAMAVNPHTGELYKGSCIGTWIYPAPY